MALGIETVVLGLALLLLVRYLVNRNLDFWSKRGVKGPRPVPILGNTKDILLGRTGMVQLLWDLYDEYKGEPYVGIFLNSMPALLLRDLNLVRDVMQTDFSKFVDRFPGPDPTFDFHETLFTMEAPAWKPTRRQMSPMFTLGKLKEQFQVILDVGENLTRYIEERVIENGVIQVKRAANKYVIDSLFRSIYGMNPHALQLDTTELEEATNRLLNLTTRNKVRSILGTLPLLYRVAGSRFQEKAANNVISRLSFELIEERLKSGQRARAGDLVGILAELKQNPDRLGMKEMTDEFLASQFFTFYMAGVETTVLMMTTLLYELAQHQEVQERLRDEIKDVLGAHEGAVTMERVNRMKYMDMVFQEVQRKNSHVGWIGRVAMEDYTFRGTNLTIPKGTPVLMSLAGIHNDPEHHPDPERFDPERFNEENVKNVKQMSFMPFGAGPRNCIGEKLAQYEVRVGLIRLLQNYRFEIIEEMEPPVFQRLSPLTMRFDREIHLRIKRV